MQLRTGTSDYYVFRHVFCLDTYKPALPPKASPRLIIDCGANSGYSSAYFLQAYPEVTVVSVEPDPRNAAVCRANLAAYGKRSKIVESAVWSHPTSLELITFGSQLTQNTQVRQLESPETTTVNAVDIPALIDVGGGGAVDLLKIDIEGSELQLFTHNPHVWLPRVKNIAIELHGQACEAAFFMALRTYNYEMKVSHDTVICNNISPKH